MILNSFSYTGIREDSVCPDCGSDLVLRFENGVLFVMCVDCSFSQVDVPTYTPRRRLSPVRESLQSSFSLV